MAKANIDFTLKYDTSVLIPALKKACKALRQLKTAIKKIEKVKLNNK